MNDVIDTVKAVEEMARLAVELGSGQNEGKPRFFGNDPAQEMRGLANVILNDTPPPVREPKNEVFGYLFALPPGDTLGVIHRGAELYHKGLVTKLFMLGLGRKFKDHYGTPALQDDDPPGTDAQMLHCGFAWWRIELAKLGVPFAATKVMVLPEENYEARFFHTHTEAQAIVEAPNKFRCPGIVCTRIVVVSAAWHIVRAMCEVVTAIIRSGCGVDEWSFGISFYAVPSGPPHAREWDAVGLGSQTTEGATTPLQELKNEVGKLVRYCEKGDLEPASRISQCFTERNNEYARLTQLFARDWLHGV